MRVFSSLCNSLRPPHLLLVSFYKVIFHDLCRPLLLGGSTFFHCPLFHDCPKYLRDLWVTESWAKSFSSAGITGFPQRSGPSHGHCDVSLREDETLQCSEGIISSSLHPTLVTAVVEASASEQVIRGQGSSKRHNVNCNIRVYSRDHSKKQWTVIMVH